MYFFVTTAAAPHSYKVFKSKEELIEWFSKTVDKNVEAGITSFDLIIEADCETK